MRVTFDLMRLEEEFKTSIARHVKYDKTTKFRNSIVDDDFVAKHMVEHLVHMFSNIDETT